MTYLYACPCGGKEERDYYGKRPETIPCALCGGIAEVERILFSGFIHTRNSDTYFNHGLGCVVRSKNDIKERIKEIEGESDIPVKIEEAGDTKLETLNKLEPEWKDLD